MKKGKDFNVLQKYVCFAFVKLLSKNLLTCLYTDNRIWLILFVYSASTDIQVNWCRNDSGKLILQQFCNQPVSEIILEKYLEVRDFPSWPSCLWKLILFLLDRIQQTRHPTALFGQFYFLRLSWYKFIPQNFTLGKNLIWHWLCF